jgi:hypothetical protein
VSWLQKLKDKLPRVGSVWSPVCSVPGLVGFPLALINELTVEEVVRVTGADRRTKGSPRELDVLDLRTRKDKDRRANRFRTSTRELLLIYGVNKANSVLFVASNMDPGVWTQPLHLRPAGWH